MSAASDYLEAATLNVWYRGVAPTFPTGTYVALHTAAPDEATGSNEVTTGQWPTYARVHAEQGGAIGTGWTAPATDTTGKSIKNTKLLPWPNMNGASPITITHVSVWDAASGGNMLDATPLDTPITLQVLDIHVFGINALTVKMS